MSRFSRSTLLQTTTVATAKLSSEIESTGEKVVSDPRSAPPRRDLVTVKNTEELHMSGRRIEVLAGFELFTNLKSLWLNDNKIQDIKHLDHCFSLQSLRLQNNRITTLKGCLRKTKFLEVLSIANNRVRDLATTLGYLRHLTYLKKLDMSGNPLCEEVNYRPRVIQALPSLKILDNHEITPDEYAKAKALGPYSKTSKPFNPPQLPFQRTGPKREPFKNEKKPLFSDLRKEAKTLRRRDAWFKSATEGDVKGVQELLDSKKIDIDSKQPGSNLSALILATKNGASHCVKLLLRSKANPDGASPTGDTALHFAAKTNGLEVLRLLLDHKATPDISNGQGKSALDIATEEKHRDVKTALSKAMGLHFHDKTAPPIYNFQKNTFWDDNRILEQVKERFSEFDESGEGKLATEDIDDFVDSLMLRVKPSSQSVEEIKNSLSEAVALADLVKKLKGCKWVPLSMEKRKKFAKDLYDDSKKMLENGVRNEETCKIALKMANHAAFLESGD
mmetsp:Transcript_17823/g.35980  ORF Transcript_17823/g.35980 Transcript_17823/m.35980 type:complete len:504 (-) Transcript_17823:64-1575(-)